MYDYICSKCGGHLDPGEKCDCEEEKERYLLKFKISKNGQYEFNFNSEGMSNYAVH